MSVMVIFSRVKPSDGCERSCGSTGPMVPVASDTVSAFFDESIAHVGSSPVAKAAPVVEIKERRDKFFMVLLNSFRPKPSGIESAYRAILKVKINWSPVFLVKKQGVVL